MSNIDDVVAAITNAIGPSDDLQTPSPTGLPKALVANAAEQLKRPYVMLVFTSGIIGETPEDPHGYNIDSVGCYIFSAVSIRDALGAAQSYLPKVIMQFEKPENLSWRKCGFMARLVRADNSQMWEVVVFESDEERLMGHLMEGFINNAFTATNLTNDDDNDNDDDNFPY